MAKDNTKNAQQDEQEEKKKKKWLLLILLLLLIAIISICLCVWTIWFRNPQLTPDYAPKDEDPNASVIEGDNQDKLDKPEGGGSVSITYLPDVTVDLSDKTASFLFQNPGRSNSDIVLQIVIQDQIIAQSGKLVPGKQLTTMELLRGAADMLSPGGYKGKFVVLLYDPETAERAVVKSEGEITVTVIQ